MSNQDNRDNIDNVEAFLFELNELLERHRATIKVSAQSLFVTAGTHQSYVGEAWNPKTQAHDPRKLMTLQTYETSRKQ